MAEPVVSDCGAKLRDSHTHSRSDNDNHTDTHSDSRSGLNNKAKHRLKPKKTNFEQTQLQVDDETSSSSAGSPNHFVNRNNNVNQNQNVIENEYHNRDDHDDRGDSKPRIRTQLGIESSIGAQDTSTYASSNSQSDANTALWVINHASHTPAHNHSHSNSYSSRSNVKLTEINTYRHQANGNSHSTRSSANLKEDNGNNAGILDPISSITASNFSTGIKVDHNNGSVSCDSKNYLPSTAQHHFQIRNQGDVHSNQQACSRETENSLKSLSQTKSVNLKNSTEDLNSVTSSHTKLRLQLKRVKLFSLRKFRSKPSMNSSNESLNSADSDSMSFSSSFVSLSRPSFPVNIKSPSTKSQTGSDRSPKSPLQLYTPHPAFNSLAGKILGSNTRSLRSNVSPEPQPADPKPSQDEAGTRSASDSTLLEELWDTDSSITEDEGITDVNSPPPSCPSPPTSAAVARSLSLPSASATSAGGAPGSSDEAAVGTKRRNMRIKSRKTHPPTTSAANHQVVGVAKDTNDFQSFPLGPKPDSSETSVFSNESLFLSEGNLYDDSSPLEEVITELTRKFPPTRLSPSSKSSKDRGHKSEPFPDGTAQQFMQTVTSRCPSGMTRSVHSLPLVCEEPTQSEHMSDAQRKAIVEEIIASEEKYVKNLEQISQAVKEIEEENLLDKELLYAIFHDLRLQETSVHHFILLDSLKKIVANNIWDAHSSVIGPVMFNTFQSSSLRDNYLAYVGKCEKSKELMKTQLSKNAAFEKFNEKFKRKNKSGQHLKEAIMLPANRLSSYLMLLERYLKYTPLHHPDYVEVPKALETVKTLLDTVGKVDNKSRKTTLKKLEELLEVSELVAPDRDFIRVDTVTFLAHRQDFRLWMFSDLILMTVNKRSTSRKDSSIVLHGQHGQDIVPGHKSSHKLHKRVGLEDTEVLNSPETEVKKYAEDIKTVESDLLLLREIQEKATLLSQSQQMLLSQIAGQITRCEQNLRALRQRVDTTDLASLRLLMQAPDGGQEYKLVFRDAKARSSWEKDFLTAKHGLETANFNKLPPEFVTEIPVDKTRAGMQFTCAASTMTGPASEKQMWFCNSDSSAAHLCRLSASSRPTLIDCAPLPNCSSRVAAMCATPAHKETELHIFDSPLTSSRLDTRQALMWLGCDDGNLHLLPVESGVHSPAHSQLILPCRQPIFSIVYIDGKVFVAVAERRILVFRRGHDGLWNTDSPHIIQLNSHDNVSQLLPVSYKLWCGCADEITILDPMLEQPERSFKVSGERNALIQCMSYCRQGIVAVALRSSCDIKLFHSLSLKHLADINVFSAVAQKLNKCDDIIRQHKMACLKITSLVSCKHMLWIGTTAGVILTLRLPKQQLSNNSSQQEIDSRLLNIDALDIGHTGNVRFLTFTELLVDSNKLERRRSVSRQSLVSKMLVISGGDGYEVIDPTTQLKDSVETVGFNDSINHLLVWKM